MTFEFSRITGLFRGLAAMSLDVLHEVNELRARVKARRSKVGAPLWSSASPAAGNSALRRGRP